jgi:hypothetical protein
MAKKPKNATPSDSNATTTTAREYPEQDWRIQQSLLRLDNSKDPTILRIFNPDDSRYTPTKRAPAFEGYFINTGNVTGIRTDETRAITLRSNPNLDLQNANQELTNIKTRVFDHFLAHATYDAKSGKIQRLRPGENTSTSGILNQTNKAGREAAINAHFASEARRQAQAMAQIVGLSIDNKRGYTTFTASYHGISEQMPQIGTLPVSTIKTDDPVYRVQQLCIFGINEEIEKSNTYAQLTTESMRNNNEIADRINYLRNKRGLSPIAGHIVYIPIAEMEHADNARLERILKILDEKRQESSLKYIIHDTDKHPLIQEQNSKTYLDENGILPRRTSHMTNLIKDPLGPNSLINYDPHECIFKNYYHFKKDE